MICSRDYLKRIVIFNWSHHHRETMAGENKILSSPAYPCDYYDIATSRHYFIYEGFSPISISFKLIGQLSSAHTKSHFI